MKRLGQVLFLLLAGCGAPEPPASPVAVVAAVEDRERTTTMLEEFTAATGIPVNLRFGDSRAVVDALLAKSGKPVDVLLSDTVADVWRAGDRGALRPVQSAALRDHHPALRDAESLWFVHEVRPMSILHAGRTTPGQVAYEDLGEAAFSGRVCLSSSTLADNRLLLAHLIDSKGNKATERLVRLWVRNLARPPFPSQAELRAAIHSGDCDYGIVSNPNTVFGNWSRTPAPRAYAATAVGVGRHAVNAEGAQALADWLLRNRSVRIPSYEALPRAGVAGWRDDEARLLAERAGYR